MDITEAVTTYPTGASQGHGDVWADIIADLPEGRLKEACKARREFGIAKHGGPLRYNDGRDGRDRLQEALDFVAYAKRDGKDDQFRVGMVLVAVVLADMERP